MYPAVMSPTFESYRNFGSRYRRVGAAALVAAFGLAVGVSVFGGARSVAAVTHTVTVGDDYFRPVELRVDPGDTVEWRWSGSSPHNVASEELAPERFRSRILTSGVFRRTFTKPGVYRYICEVHPRTMRARVVVGDVTADRSAPNITRLAVSGGRRQAVVAFNVSESARVKVALSGRSTRSVIATVSSRRARFKFARLRAGRYRATIVVQDFAGNRRTFKSKRFTVR